MLTDLELMQLLEDEGYETTLENLLILKEGLTNGSYTILDEARREVKYFQQKQRNGGGPITGVNGVASDYQNRVIADRARANNIGRRAGETIGSEKRRVENELNSGKKIKYNDVKRMMDDSNKKIEATSETAANAGAAKKSLARNRNDYQSEDFTKYMERYKARNGAKGYDEKEMMRRAKASYASSQNYKRKREASKASAEAAKTATMTPQQQLKTSLLQRKPELERRRAERIARNQANPQQANPQQANPTQANPTQANPTQANPQQANPQQATPTQANPQQATTTNAPAQVTQNIKECLKIVREDAFIYDLQDDDEYILETVIDILSDELDLRDTNTTAFLLEMCGFEGSFENVSILQETYIPQKEVNISDYELYQILEANGYTTTKENLEILKEGIIAGKYEIE